MKITVTQIGPSEIPDTVELSVRFGVLEEKKYKVSHYEQDGVKGGNIEEELFFRLSELGIRNLCNSAFYHFEVGMIVERYLKNESLPECPIDITESGLGLKKPTTLMIIKGRIWRICHGMKPFGDGDPLKL